MAHVKTITVHPVKSLSQIEVDSARITPGGVLENDRMYAIHKSDGDAINGIQLSEVHDIDADFDFERERLSLKTRDGDAREFDLREDRSAAEEWFSDFFDLPVTIRRDASDGFVSRPEAGPSVVSTATLEEVASWFDDITPTELRRRIRVNVEVSGVPAFWEDQFVGADAPAFEIGGVRFEGVQPCGRCVIPQRDPDTGERTPNFRTTFLERREETFPEFADRDAFDHLFKLMLIAGVPESDRGETIRVGDEVRVVE
jgi:uncharacterized protein YcbX